MYSYSSSTTRSIPIYLFFILTVISMSSFIGIHQVSGDALIVQISQPTNSSEVSESIIVRGHVPGLATNDNSKVRIKIDQGDWESVDSAVEKDGCCHWAWAWNTKQVIDGEHRVCVKASDGSKWTEQSWVLIKTNNGISAESTTEDDFEIAGQNGYFVIGGGAILIVVPIIAIAIKRRNSASKDAVCGTQWGTGAQNPQQAQQGAVTPTLPQGAARPAIQQTQQVTQVQPTYQQPGMQAAVPNYPSPPSPQTYQQPIPQAAPQTQAVQPVPQQPQQQVQQQYYQQQPQQAPAAMPQQSVQIPQQQIPQSNRWRCPGCWHDVDEGFVFCTNCGTKKPV